MPAFPTVVASNDSVDHGLLVSMLDDHVVFGVPTPIDLEMTELLVVAAASGVAAGSTVMIDLDPDTSSGDLVARRPLGAIDASCVTHDGGPVTVLGAGSVRISTRDAHWTIDLANGRLCRSDSTVEPQFVRPDAWIRIHALWVNRDQITALTSEGTYLTTIATWRIPHTERAE